MPVETAALVLSWIAIVVLALALAGLVRQVREVRAVVVDGFGPSFLTGAAPSALHPSPGKDGTVVLVLGSMDADRALVDALERAARGRDAIEFKVLAEPGADVPRVAGVHVVADGAAAAQVRLPWYPALVHVGRDGVVADAAPVGAPEAVARVVETFLAEDATSRRS
ncbi:MAG TPA: hypothetical protein VHJ34_07465 [Actinomycetota bacterium]|nr:hypothetical protein [Actinomycetota bacterium]